MARCHFLFIPFEDWLEMWTCRYLLELIEDEELRLKMSYEARKKAVNNYDSRIIATKIIDNLKLLFSWCPIRNFYANSC